MKSIAKMTLMLGLVVLLGSCTETSADDPMHFVVYGTIVEATGNPVQAAEVSLYTGTYHPNSNIGSSRSDGCIGTSVTGSDGQYEMNCVTTENLRVSNGDTYTLYVESPSGGSRTKTLTLTVAEGRKIRQDAVI